MAPLPSNPRIEGFHSGAGEGGEGKMSLNVASKKGIGAQNAADDVATAASQELPPVQSSRSLIHLANHQTWLD